MKRLVAVFQLFVTVLAGASTNAVDGPRVTNAHGIDVTYEGIYANQVESFVGIRYGRNTGGSQRFKPPVAYTPAPHANIEATTEKPACPQALDDGHTEYLLRTYSHVTEISEDCLRLNVWRPNGTKPSDKLPVLVYIHGGSFIFGSKDGEISQPGGMILKAKAAGQPIMNVDINYRLGVFGFAQSAALKKEGSENAGLRDQRLALEWVYQNIAAFGGDPSRITIHGQSSGGLAVGMQIMAYGASKAFPFQQAICQSQCLEVAITTNVTRTSLAATTAKTKCAHEVLDSAANVACLRSLSMKELLDAQLAYAPTEPTQNDGDYWLPVVDGDFLPAAPSKLIAERRFAKKMRAIIGWTEDDYSPFVEVKLKTSDETYKYLHEFTPWVTATNLRTLLSLYPSSEYSPTWFPNGTIARTIEVNRASRILRDLFFTCHPFLYGEALAAVGNTVYYYDQNRTLLTEGLEQDGSYGLGVPHTAELLYVFGNLTKYKIPGYPYHPTPEDYRLERQESLSWSLFTATGETSSSQVDTLKGWRPADHNDPNYGVFVIGGPAEGYSGPGGRTASQKAIGMQKLHQRCDFVNSPAMVIQLGY